MDSKEERVNAVFEDPPTEAEAVDIRSEPLCPKGPAGNGAAESELLDLPRPEPPAEFRSVAIPITATSGGCNTSRPTEALTLAWMPPKAVDPPPGRRWGVRLVIVEPVSFSSTRVVCADRDIDPQTDTTMAIARRVNRKSIIKGEMPILSEVYMGLPM